MTSEELLNRIPFGHDHAVSRIQLAHDMQMTDRQLRKVIHDLRETYPILNLSDGTGYFRPDPEDKEDMARLRHYRMQEMSRIESTWKALKAVNKMFGSTYAEGFEQTVLEL